MHRVFKTWQINFTHTSGKEDEIQFCAETRQEAIDLFTEWCNTTGILCRRIDDILTVYSQLDKEAIEEDGDYYCL